MNTRLFLCSCFFIGATACGSERSLTKQADLVGSTQGPGGDAAAPVGTGTNAAATDPSATTAETETTTAATTPLAQPAVTALGSDGHIVLAIAPVADATSYEISRAAPGESFSVIATTSETHYEDHGINSLTRYRYVVRAVGGDAASEPSQEASATAYAFDTLALDDFGGLLLGFAAGGGTKVAVGLGGLAMRSTDGNTWERTFIAPSYFYDVAFGNGRFVAVGSMGFVYHSTDGLNWEAATAPSAQTYKSIAYGGTGSNAKFVAVSSDGVVALSADGITFTEATASPLLIGDAGTPRAQLNGVAIQAGAPDRFVVVGENGFLRQSGDGETWGAPMFGSGTGSSLRAIEVVTLTINGQPLTTMLAVGVSNTMVYRHGPFWIDIAPASGSHWASLATDGEGDIMVVSTSGGALARCTLATCSNANHAWEASVVEDTAALGFDGSFYGVGNGALVWRLDATPTLLNQRQHQWYTALATNPTRVVALGSSALATSDDDGASWTVHPGTADLDGGATYGNGRFVGVGDGGVAAFSNDGIEWTTTTTGTANRLNGVAFGAGAFVAVGDGGKILRSTDGETWSPVASGTAEGLYDVSHLDGWFVVSGNKGIALVSEDGLVWESRSIGEPTALNGATSNGKQWVFAGNSGKVFITTDCGLSFTKYETGITYNLNSISFGGAHFVLTSGNGRVLHSADGVQWQLRTLRAATHVEASVLRSGRWIFAGWQGLIASTH